MSTEIQLDGRLRPCYEYQASVNAAVMSFAATKMPYLMGVPFVSSYATAIGLGLLGVAQYYKGRKLRRYQEGLRNLQPFFIQTEDLPVSEDEFWLGRGYEVTQVHAQRMYECNTPNGIPYTKPSKAYNRARQISRKAKKQGASWPIKTLAKRLDGQHFVTVNLGGKKVSLFKNPVAPYPNVGGEPYLHGVGIEDETDVLTPLKSMEGHVLVMGTTGCGKTRAAEIFLTADIARKIKRTIQKRTPSGDIEKQTVSQPDGCVVCFDPKGDPELLARVYSEAKRAGRPFIFFHLGEAGISARYNGVGNFSRLSEVATRISGQLAGSGDSAAFKEFAWRFISIIAKALFSMGLRPSYQDIRSYIMDMESLFIRYAEHYLAELGVSDWRVLVDDLVLTIKKVPENLKGASRRSVALDSLIQSFTQANSIRVTPAYEGLLNAVKYDASYFSKITASLLPLLEKLCSGDNLEILSPDYSDMNDTRPILDWTQAIRQGAAVYCGFAAMVDRDVASAVSNSMLSDLLSLSGKIYQSGINYGVDAASPKERANVYLHLDEANEMCGDEYIPILNKARGAGLRVIAYTQSRQDFEVRLGDKAKAQVVESNYNTIIMFRVKTEDTAKLLTDQLKEVNIYDLSVGSMISPELNVDDESLMTTRINNSVSIVKTQKLLKPDDIISLPKGQAYALLEGSKLYKLRFPLPKESAHTLPPELSLIYSKMKKQYRSYDNWWEKEAA